MNELKKTNFLRLKFGIIKLIGGDSLEKTKRWIKNNLIFFVSLIILFISIIFSIVIFNVFRIQSDLESTRIGHVYLGSDENSYSNILNQSVTDFLDDAEYNITYQNESYYIDFDYFDFSVTETINNINDNQNNTAYFSVNNLNNFETSLISIFSENVINGISLEDLVDDIEEKLGKLEYFSVFDLRNYLNEGSVNTVLLEKSYSIADSTIVNQLSEITEITISPVEQFSLLEELVDYNIDNETLSFLASMMQNLTMESHFTNYIFQTYSSFPAWADNNMNVKILKVNNFDFAFYNSLNQEYRFEINIIDSTTVKLKLLGAPYVNTYTIQEITIPVEYDTIYIDDPDLVDVTYKIDETDTEIIYQKVLETGENGSIHQFVRTTSSPNDETITSTIFYTKIDSSPEVISENVVLKAGG